MTQTPKSVSTTLLFQVNFEFSTAMDVPDTKPVFTEKVTFDYLYLIDSLVLIINHNYIRKKNTEK